MTSLVPSIQHTVNSETDHLSQAVSALGWHGDFLPHIRLLGMRVSVVVDVDPVAIARRVEQECAIPMLDWDTLTMWEWPEGNGIFPPSPLAVVGVLVSGVKQRKRALTFARRWAGFCSSATTLESAEPITPEQLLDVSYYGVGVVARPPGTDEYHLVRPSRTGRLPSARRTTMDRWVEETLFGMLASIRPSAGLLS